jgi:hypothetical protein
MGQPVSLYQAKFFGNYDLNHSEISKVRLEKELGSYKIGIPAPAKKIKGQNLRKCEKKLQNYYYSYHTSDFLKNFTYGNKRNTCHVFVIYIRIIYRVGKAITSAHLCKTFPSFHSCASSALPLHPLDSFSFFPSCPGRYQGLRIKSRH